MLAFLFASLWCEVGHTRFMVYVAVPIKLACLCNSKFQVLLSSFELDAVDASNIEITVLISLRPTFEKYILMRCAH